MCEDFEYDEYEMITAEQAAGIDVVNVKVLRKLMRKRWISDIKKVCFPDAIKVDVRAFADWSVLEVVELPKCVKVEAGAFENCESLKSVSLPLCKKIGVKAFHDCSSLEDIDIPSCMQIFDKAFCGCMRLDFMDLPACETIGSAVFEDCRYMTVLKLPACKKIPKDLFWGDEEDGFPGGMELKVLEIPKIEDFTDGSPFDVCTETTITVSSSIYNKWVDWDGDSTDADYPFGENVHLILADED